ncbi:MAG: hypothetical protein NTX53_07555 [candidate division WOR-3 bacterium]|nr:hypothetical protein [candidate division WOR-3 bacterium]
MSATRPRVIGRPAARLSRARETAFRKAVRDVLAGRGGNGRGHSEARIGRTEPCYTQSLAEHLKPFSGSRVRRARSRVPR